MNNNEKKSHIGCDESGVGDYFGGITVCAAFADSSKYEFYRSLGVTDSKKISNKKIIEIYNILIRSEKYVCLSCNPVDYNYYVKKFKNTHILKAFLHNQAIEKLIKKYDLDKFPIIMDQFANESLYYKYFEKIKIKPHKISLFETKAEIKYMGVAIASIIARANFLIQIRELSEKISIKLQLGSSNPKIIDDAKKIYRLYGVKKLNEFVKIGFRTTEQVVINE
jgi:ribonuclease HIII